MAWVETADFFLTQLPVERTCVTFLLNIVRRKEPYVLVAVAAVAQNNPGICSDFEQATTFLVPNYAMKSQRKKKNIQTANVGIVGRDQQGPGKRTC